MDGDDISANKDDEQTADNDDEQTAALGNTLDGESFPKAVESDTCNSSVHLSECDSAAAETAISELEEIADAKEYKPNVHAIATSSGSANLATYLKVHGTPLHDVSTSLDSVSMEEDEIMQDFLTQCHNVRRATESEVSIPLEYMNELLGRLVETSNSSTPALQNECPAVRLRAVGSGPPATVFAKVEALFNAVHPLPSLEIVGCIVALHGDPEWQLQLVQLFEVIGVSHNWCILRACHFHSYYPKELSQLALVDVQAPWGAGKWEMDDRCLIFQELIDAVALPSWQGWMRFEHHHSSRFKQA